jgi:type III secretion protein V
MSSRLHAWFAQRQDIVLPVMLMAAVFMTILPLPTALVDVLISINFLMSSALLMIAVFVRNPLDMSVFPSLLLITTLYRLALTISTCRLILLQHDAGDIVTAFGDFVVGDNLIVGLVVFLIIAVVQFLVVTKGAERVAEVLARFSLDGMPGAQMSIDGDLRAGIIDAHEAKRQREVLRKTSQMYGAMDGALKFVKGDAIASMIVIVVNIVGGICVGVLQHGMTTAQAASTYTILSIGDGLVSQIPALVISVAAGIIATRVPDATDQGRHLAQDMSLQLSRDTRPIWITGAVMGVFTILPGFPILAFGTLAIALVGTAIVLGRRVKRDPAADAGASGDGRQQLTPGATPLRLRLSASFRRDAMRQRLAAFCREKYEQTGIPYPDFELESDADFAAGRFQLFLYGEMVLDVTPCCGQPMVVAHCGLPAVEEIQRRPLFGDLALVWVTETAAAILEARGVPLLRDDACVVGALSVVLDQYAREFVGVQETQFLMNAMEKKYADLVRELHRQMAIGRVADVLQRLVEEQVSIRDLRTVFETLVVWGGREKDVVLLTEYVRVALRRHILARSRTTGDELVLWTVGVNIENMIRESVRQTAAGSYSALSATQSKAIVDCIVEMVEQQLTEYGRPVLATAVDVRRYVRKLIEPVLPSVPVLSFQELGDQSKSFVLGDIDLSADEVESATTA